MTHLDTSFLVDLMREATQRVDGPATRFLEALADEDIGVSVHVLCELEAGARLSAHPQREMEKVRRACSLLHVSYPDERFAPTYGRILAELHRKRRTIATMDLLIAVAAVGEGAALVTGNAKHFEPIEGLLLRTHVRR
jgi:tRNA(fMet)-specific endonuclease VapC